MILADGINLPIVLLLGLVTIGPLTLLVVAVESLTFRGVYRVRLRASLRVILVANILSTLAGLVVYMFQDALLYAVGVRTAADFARHYLPGALVMIGLYFLVSVVVEGLYVSGRRAQQFLPLGRGRLWQAVVVANIASYLAMGPVFYFSTRPTFNGVRFTDNAGDVSDCSDMVYFTADATGHLCRIRANGQDFAEVVPDNARDFLVSADQSAFLYRAEDGNLWFLRQGDSRSKIVWRTGEGFYMTEVDLSADKTRVAYACRSKVVVYDLAAERILVQTDLSGEQWHPVGLLGWDADDPNVLHLDRLAPQSGPLTWRIEGDSLAPVAASGERLVGNFRRCTPGSFWGGGNDRGVPLAHEQHQGNLTLRSTPGLGAHIWVGTKDQTVALFHNDYGLLGLGHPGPYEACFLSAPGVLLCGGSDGIYVLNALQKRAALLADGRNFVIAIPAFQASLSNAGSEPLQASGRRQTAYSLTMIVSFWPPKPNEFDSATRTGALRASLGT